MADANDKVKDNVTGRFFVDSQCIDCNLCRETAPKNFKQNEDAGYSFVYKQPESDKELAQCKEAKDACPVEAIGDGGEGGAVCHSEQGEESPSTVPPRDPSFHSG